MTSPPIFIFIIFLNTSDDFRNKFFFDRVLNTTVRYCRKQRGKEENELARKCPSQPPAGTSTECPDRFLSFFFLCVFVPEKIIEKQFATKFSTRTVGVGSTLGLHAVPRGAPPGLIYNIPINFLL